MLLNICSCWHLVQYQVLLGMVVQLAKNPLIFLSSSSLFSLLYTNVLKYLFRMCWEGVWHNKTCFQILTSVFAKMGEFSQLLSLSKIQVFFIWRRLILPSIIFLPLYHLYAFGCFYCISHRTSSSLFIFVTNTQQGRWYFRRPLNVC